MRIRFFLIRGISALILAAFTFWSVGQEIQSTDVAGLHAEEIKKGLRQISSQIVRLRLANAQSDQSQFSQNQIIQKQIEGIALSHSRLVEQLMVLQADSQKQIIHLQEVNQKLKWYLGLLVSLAGATLLTLLIKKTIKNTRKEPSGTHLKERNASDEVASSGQINRIDQAKGLREMFATTPRPDQADSATEADSTEATDAVKVRNSSTPSSAPRTPHIQSSEKTHLSHLIADEVRGIEETLLQARQDFMKPVKIPN